MIMEPAGSVYFVVLQSVPSERQEDVVSELMVLFNIERTHATQIASNVPIVLMGRLNERQVQNARSHLVRLHKLGAAIDVATTAPAGVRALSWPVLPQIAIQPANVFMCPTCGERFVVRPFKATVPEARKPAPAPAPQPAPAPPKPAEPPPAEAAEVVEAEAAEVVDEEPVEAAEAVEEPPADAEPAAAVARLAPEEPEPAEAAEEEDEFQDVAVQATAPEPGAQAEAAAASKAAEGQLFRVSLRQRVKGSQREQVAQLIAKYQKVSEKEALRLLDRPMVSVLRRASKQEADACRKAFKDIGIAVVVKEMLAPKE
jgi:ribosomal protein L7/L12